MNKKKIDEIASAVLYEGYLLYPYRPSVKNRQRWTFGGLYPKSYSDRQRGTDPWFSQTECLVSGERKLHGPFRAAFGSFISSSAATLPARPPAPARAPRSGRPRPGRKRSNARSSARGT